LDSVESNDYAHPNQNTLIQVHSTQPESNWILDYPNSLSPLTR